jgi:hypothetical protein
MELDKDFNEFVELFVANDVRFLVVGGYAPAALLVMASKLKGRGVNPETNNIMTKAIIVLFL